MSNKKNVLLINPHIEDFAAYDHFSKPLGLLMLAAYLKEHFSVHFINALNRLHPSLPRMKFGKDGTGNFHKIFIDKPQVLSDIPRRFKRYGLEDNAFINELKSLPEKPDFVFITSGMTYWYTGIKHTIGLVKEVYPASKILLGGIYASLLPGHADKLPGVDYVIPYQEINSALSELESILSVRFSREFKPPDYKLLGEYYYVPLLTSSGCVFNCNYCASGYLSKFRQFPVELIIKTIVSLYKNRLTANFAFYDDALLVDSENHIDKILEGIIAKGINTAFYTPNGLHIRYLTEKTAHLMRETGFLDLRLALESSDPSFQKNEGNKVDNAQFNNAIEILYRAGFERRNIRVYTLLNVPGLNTASVEKTMDTVYNTGALPMLSYYLPIPHTKDFEKAGQITNLEEPLFQNNTVYLYRSGFEMEYLKHLKNLELEYRHKSLKENPGNSFQ